jgi:hypothetical protein
LEQVASFGVLRVAWGGRNVNLVIMTITRQKVTLNEYLAKIDVIRKHVMLSDESQHETQTADMRYRTKAVLKITRARSILLLHVLSLYDKTDLTVLEGVILSFYFIVKSRSQNVIFRIEG